MVLGTVKQLEAHHPEGCVLTHSLQCATIAFRETIDTDLILAALLHDIGKIENSLGHEELAIKWLEPYCSIKTLWLIEHHMRIWYYIRGEMYKLSKCKELAEHPFLSELIQLARFDKFGRNPNKIVLYNKSDIIDRLNKASKQHFSKPQITDIQKIKALKI